MKSQLTRRTLLLLLLNCPRSQTFEDGDDLHIEAWSVTGSGQEKRKGGKKNGGGDGDEPESRGDEDEPDIFYPAKWATEEVGSLF